MNLIELRSQIISKDLNKLYYFTGEEWKLMSIYAKQIAQTSNKKLYYVDSIEEILSSIKQTSIFADTNCYVVYEDTNYLTNESAWDKLETLIKKDIIIFIYNSIDKRSKFYKHFKDTLVEFNYMSNDILLKHLANSGLNDKNKMKLITACESDYGRILIELDKIKNLYPEDVNKGCDVLFEKKLIEMPPKDAVFDLVDSLIKHNLNAFSLYEECKKVGENSLVILTNLFRTARYTYQVQTYKGTNDLCKVTGLKAGTIWGCKQRLGYRTNKELVGIMRLAQRIEEGIKTGKIDEEIAIDYLMVKLLC